MKNSHVESNPSWLSSDLEKHVFSLAISSHQNGQFPSSFLTVPHPGKFKQWLEHHLLGCILSSSLSSYPFFTPCCVGSAVGKLKETRNSGVV